MSFFTYTKRGDYGTEVNVGKIIAHVVIALVALTFLFGSFGTIDAGERGVHTRLGNIVGTKEPGLYFKLPLIDTVRKFNTKTQVVMYEREDPLAAASSDLQDVNIATVMNYHLDPTAVTLIYEQFGRQDVFEENVIRPAVRDTVKAVASQFTAEALVTKRIEFTDAVTAKLTERLQDKHVVVERVNITNFQFSASFSESIEAKVTAEQQALKAENDLARVKFEAEQKVEQAKAEAEAIRIQAQAITQQGGKDYVQLKAIEKWNGTLPAQMIPGGTVPFIDLSR